MVIARKNGSGIVCSGKADDSTHVQATGAYDTRELRQKPFANACWTQGVAIGAWDVYLAASYIASSSLECVKTLQYIIYITNELRGTCP